MINKETASWNNHMQQARRRTLEGLGLRVDEVWECEIKAMLKKDPEMREFFSNAPEIGRLNPRDAYFGGRTGKSNLNLILEKYKFRSNASLCGCR
jgi:hypothetical protein